ncbi:MAG: D-alanyl-D-alanine carboxypeptidase family protein [Candidatus Omnitrophota bacterium]|jgi:D-alanyl-D-alanine carboxypeptidase
MFRKILIPLFIIFLSSNLLAKETVYVTARSAVLMKIWNKKLVYSKNPHTKLAPASTTKIMTALVVLRRSPLNKKVVVSRNAAFAPPSKVDIKKGERYSTEDMLKALLLNSGNDASIALAESVAGTEKAFTKLMNEAARKIGCRNTNFETSNGLPAKGQYSTAYDLALIMREAIKDKRLLDILRIKNAEITELNTGRRIKLRNHNKSLWKDTPYSMLGKTGYTIKAGQCFLGYIKYDKRRDLIVVVMKGKKLWPDLKELAEKGRKML